MIIFIVKIFFSDANLEIMFEKKNKLMN